MDMFTQSTTLKLYLENLLIQDPGAEHSNAIGADGTVVTPEERLGDLLLTVDNDGDRLLLHTDGHTMPPGERHNKERWEIKKPRSNKSRWLWLNQLLWCR